MWTPGAPYQMSPVTPVISSTPYLVYGPSYGAAALHPMAAPRLTPYAVHAGQRLPPLSAPPAYSSGFDANANVRPALYQSPPAPGDGGDRAGGAAPAAPYGGYGGGGGVVIRPQHQSSGPHNIIAGVYLDDMNRRVGGGGPRYVHEGTYQSPWGGGYGGAQYGGGGGQPQGHRMMNVEDLPPAGLRKVPRDVYNIVTGQGGRWGPGQQPVVVSHNQNGQSNANYYYEAHYPRNNNDFHRNGTVAMDPVLRNIASSGAPYDILTGQPKARV